VDKMTFAQFLVGVVVGAIAMWAYKEPKKAKEILDKLPREPKKKGKQKGWFVF
tara:strand:+ start:3347 stop:3505 length:159 start_codon:yes stop_codon:yes gene_type:complete